MLSDPAESRSATMPSPGPQGLDAGKGLSQTHSNQHVSKATALRKKKEIRNPSLEWETALQGA